MNRSRGIVLNTRKHTHANAHTQTHSNARKMDSMTLAFDEGLYTHRLITTGGAYVVSAAVPQGPTLVDQQLAVPIHGTESKKRKRGESLSLSEFCRATAAQLRYEGAVFKTDLDLF